MDFDNQSFYAPTEEDIAQGEKTAALLKRYATLKSYNVRVFDMSVPSDIEDYKKAMVEIMEGIPKKTHFVWNKEKTIVNGNWKIFLEWSVYTLTDPSKPKEENDDQK